LEKFCSSELFATISHKHCEFLSKTDAIKAQYKLTNFPIYWYFGAERFAEQNGSIFKYKATRGLLLGETHLSSRSFGRFLGPIRSFS
jgi:hypothetical protein